MADYTAAFITTTQALSGGVASVPTTQSESNFSFSGTPVIGDEITLLITDLLTGLQTQLGAGDSTGAAPVYCLTYNQKMYVLTGSTVYFCAINQPIVWNDPNAIGNGFVVASNYDGSPMQLLGVAHYQGRLVFFSRESILIYQIDANPANWQLLQTLEHVGTVAKNTIKTIGDLDVYFLSDTGVQSLRVRDNTLNAVPSSVGDPINSLLLAVMQGATPNISGACAVVEPTASRYWMFLKDTIYVLSSFPNSKVLAWSTYKPSYDTSIGAPVNIGISETGNNLFINSDTLVASSGEWVLQYSDDAVNFTDDVSYSQQAVTAGVFPLNAWNLTGSPAKRYWRVKHTVVGPSIVGYSNIWDSTNRVSVANQPDQTAFVPYKFGIYGGQVYARGADGAIYQYGGTNNNTFDTAALKWQTGFMDAKTPGTKKMGRAIDVVCNTQLTSPATWTVYASMDEKSAGDPTTDLSKWKKVYTNTAHSFDIGQVGYSGVGTHFSLYAETSGTGPAVFSEVLFHYDIADEKG